MIEAHPTHEISSASFDASAAQADENGLNLGELLAMLAAHWKLLLAGPLAAAALAAGYSYTLPPTFTASTTLLPPQQGQSGTAAALASLGSLAGLAGGAAGVRNQSEQYVAMLESNTVTDRVVDEFKLMDVYGQSLRTGARARLAASSRIGISKTSGLIGIDVTDTDPTRAAAIANRYVLELRRLTGSLALTDAQRRRTFFENLLTQSRDRLAETQRSLQASGFNASALRSEPKATAETYAKLQGEMAAAEVRLQSLRGSLTDSATEVQHQQATVSALRAQSARTERPSEGQAAGDYVTRYREFKYQETLFELYARQFELARADESRDSDSVQVIDPATPPELKSGPKRLSMAGMAAAITALVLVVGVLLRGNLRSRRRAGTA